MAHSSSGPRTAVGPPRGPTAVAPAQAVPKWSVVNEETSGERRRARLPRNLPRLALILVLAVVVLTLGLVVRPGKPAEPAPPTASEKALAAALTDTLELRSDAERLTGAGTAADGTVSFLTTQARALWRPGSATVSASPSPAPSGAATPGESPAPASPSPAAVPTAAPVTAASLVTALDASGRQRLADAAAADPGTARLLASIGTGQLLQASALAAATGTPDPATTGAPASAPASAAPATASATPSPSACPSATDFPSAAPSASASASPARADLANALAEVISTERETVYAYQVALTRLDGTGAAAAATRLTRHEALAAAAEALSRQHCAASPPRQAGYALDPAFLASPAAGLRGLEAGSLAAYADLVGLSDGSTRQWAVSGLLEAGRRAAAWGAPPEPSPGLSVDPAELPTLPAAVAG